MGFDWYRRWHETEGDVKFKTISRTTGKHITWVKSVWETVLTFASKHHERGSIDGLCIADVSTENDLLDEDVEIIIKAFVSKGLIVKNRLSSWEIRQFSSDEKTDNTKAKRQAEFRARKKAEREEQDKALRDSNASVTPRNAKATPSNAPDTDTDTDTDIKEKDSSNEESKKKADAFFLPDWVPKESWDGFVEMRKRIKKPLSAYAARLIVGKLDDLRNKGDPPGDVLDRSTINGWAGVFPLPAETNQKQTTRNGGSNAKPTITDELTRLLAGGVDAGRREPIDVTARPSICGPADIRQDGG